MVFRVLSTSLLAVAVLTATAAGARADTLVTPAPGARNLTANGGLPGLGGARPRPGAGA
jgi:hypothetical protein